MLTALLILASQAAVAEEEIVVTAVRGKCRAKWSERVLTERELAARAEEWAGGTAVRIVAPRGEHYRCLAKIAFKLHGKGVRLIHFVEANDTR